MFLLPQIKVRKTSKKGKGVFATDIIESGKVVGDYLGTVTPTDEGTDKYEDDAVYDMWYSDEVDICPDPDSDGMHLVNTSCEPNCAMTALGRHTILFALRKIFPGEELTYDYFLGEQDEDCEPGSDNCHCGSDFCRGTMYSNPKAYEEWEEHLEEIMEGLPEGPPVPFGEELPPLDSYPDSIEDNDIYPIFGYAKTKPHKCESDILGSKQKMRQLIRETGQQLAIEELGVIVEGIMHGDHISLKHMVKSSRASSNKSSYAQDKKLPVSSSQ
jgi:hypothetical protein